MTVEELAQRLRRVADAAEQRAADACVNAMARSTRRFVLRELSGPSPSAPHAPPGRETGELMASVRIVPAAGGGTVATANLAPHTIYAAIQEHGGTVRAHSGPGRGIAYHGHARRPVGRHSPDAHTLFFISRGERHFPKEVTLPDRPYMAPAAAWANAGGANPAGASAVGEIIREAWGG
jgi:hypothetical protein